MRRWATLAFLGALLTGGPAEARLQVTPGRIIVTSASGARAVISRQPFGIAFSSARGSQLLREVPAAASLAQIAPLPQTQFGKPLPSPPTLYSPLTFLVGTQSITATPTTQWEGNLQSVTEGGVAYHAKGVEGVQARGGGARLTLSTTDPTGRKLVVLVAPGADGGIHVSARPQPATGVATMADAFTSPGGEAFHGFGGRHDALDQRGRAFYNWIDQENLSSGSADGLTKPTAGSDFLFPNGSLAGYYDQAAFVSSRGYGFLLEDPELSHWRMASDRRDAWQVENGAPHLDYTVLPSGAVKQAVSALNGVTGRHPAPPAWSLGITFDREVRFPSDPPAQYYGEVESDLANFHRYHVHVDAYRIEGWAELPEAQLRQVIAQLRALRIHPQVYFRAFVGTDTTGTDFPADYNYAISHGYVATRADGSPYVFVANFNAPTALIDFTNPAARRWWAGRVRHALGLGADGFMQDFGEQVMPDMHFHDGSTGLEMHNRYPVLYHQTTRQIVDAYERSHPGRRIFFYTRSGYSGTPGSSAYENANFAGDETTDWSRSGGLASLTTDMLNRAVGGAFGYTTDIGGYFDIGPYQPTTKELFIRWAEWAALSPFYRLHGSLLAGMHTPWSYDGQTVSIYKRLGQLHARLVPYILRSWRAADRFGIPLTRPLWLAYPGDPRAARQDQEWLLGSDLLAAPVVGAGAASRGAYLPAGCWRLRGRGSRLLGPRSLTVPAPLGSAVYFTRCGRDPLRGVARTHRRARH